VRTPLPHARTFSLLRTHVVCDRALSGDVDTDRATLLRALAAGAAWLSCPFVALAHGARLWAELADGQTLAMGAETAASRAVLRLRLPEAAQVTFVRDGAQIHSQDGSKIDLDVAQPGVYRVEARIDGRLWLLSNPIHLRADSGIMTSVQVML
jgi:hypothetical protein